MREHGSPLVLVVDDDLPVQRMLARTLAAEGHEVAVAADGAGALVEVERRVPDLVVLDVTMPGIDGLAVCRRLRAAGHALPILLLTARDAVADRVAGLDAGGDDYLVKPFDPDELTARVRALLRRGHPEAPRLAAGGLELDLEQARARREGREVELTRREAELLALLLRNPGRVVTREVALAGVWGDEQAVTSNAVDRFVANLRRKLGDPPVIRTVRGVGFVLER